MRELLSNRIQLFIRNREIMKKNFKLEYSMIHYLCSYIYTENNKILDPDKIKEAKKIINKNTGIFSYFKGVAKLAESTKLSLKNDMEGEFLEVLKTYKLLKKEFRSSEYLPSVACFISENRHTLDVENLIKKSAEVYKLMKSNHPFLTSSEDVMLATLLAMTKENIDETINSMEYAYKKLKKHFISSNSVQSVSHVLTLTDGDIDLKINKLLNIFNKLRENNLKYGKTNELTILAILALSEKTVDEIARDIVDIFNVLKKEKLVGFFSATKAQGLMFAALLLIIDYTKESNQNAFKEIAVKSVISIIIEEIALMSTVAITSAAAASSASS